MIDLSNVIALALGSDEVLEIQDSVGTVLWQKVQPVVNYNVSISAGSNGSVTVNGVAGNYSATVPAGTTLTLVATPDSNYQFNGWSDGDNNTTRTITVTGDITLTASFTAIMYNVSISAGNNGSVSVNGVAGNYSQSVQQGTVLTIEGTGNTGYDFDEWSDGNTDNPRTITVSGDLTLTASFESAVTYYNVSISAGSNGSVSVNGVVGNYSQSVPEGTVLTIEAIADNRYIFNHWDDDYTDNPRTITVDWNYMIVAEFEADLNNTYFYVEDVSGANNTLSIKKTNSGADTIEVFKSTDQVNWTSMGSTSTTAITATIPAYGKLYLKATVNSWAYSQLYYNNITANGNHNIGGNIQSLRYGDNFENYNNLSSYAFNGLFNNDNKLINANDLILPRYVAQYCYQNMFSDCTNLIVAPALPATTLYNKCYQNMFYRCTSLTTAPTLPAKTLAEACYKQMFYYCSLLNSVTTYANNISATDCLTDWLKSVAAQGDLYNFGSVTYTIDSASGIPVGWTEHTYFYVEDVSGANNTLSIKKTNSGAPTITVYKSTDQVNWTSMGTTGAAPITATVPANGKLYLKASTTAWGNSSKYANQFTCTGNYNIGGDVMSLLRGDGFVTGRTLNSANQHAFRQVFNDTNLISASNLKLPSNTVANCYRAMFSHATNLTGAPVLPATTATNNCYSYMFEETALVTAPALPIATLTNADECCNAMFKNCTSLTTAPTTLPATSLVSKCYQDMFNGCTSLTTAPTLPATTLATYCYSGMFKGCTSLTTAPALNATSLQTYCYNAMFSGCTNLVNIPATLPATTLKSTCYAYMFSDTAITTAPTLPATTLVSDCYKQMFRGCANLNTVITYAQNTIGLSNWLSGVSLTGDFYNLGGATFASGASGIPTGWTVHTSL